VDTSETATLPAPAIEMATVANNKWAREFEAFQRLLPQLLAAHRGKYVVIHEGHVVDAGDDDLALALRFFSRHGNVPIHVGLVTEQPEPIVHIPHYRMLEASEGLM
jgi:hypothetical protein